MYHKGEMLRHIRFKGQKMQCKEGEVGRQEREEEGREGEKEQ